MEGLAEFVYVGRPHECWPARQYRTQSYSTGYRCVGRGGEGVHRLAFRLAYGYEPDTVDHLCERKVCANPLHLENVTRGENSVRHYHRRRKDACPKGHEWTPENTYVRQGGTTRVCRACRRESMRALKERRRQREARTEEG